MSRHRLATALLTAALPLAMLGSLTVGVYPVPPALVPRILVALAAGHATAPGQGWTQTQALVIAVVRLPRVALATLAGAALGLSGATLQGVFRNPLVGPDIVGVSSGAAVGGVLAISLGWDAGATTALAFAGGLAALAVAAALARWAKAEPLGVVLAGVLVAAFGSALVGLAEFLADPNGTLPGIVYWLMGSFVDATRAKVLTMGLATLIGGGGLLALRWRINLLSLGDEDAAALGVRTGPLRWGVVALVALLVAAQVAVSGVIGWAGLVVPHAARALVGPDHRRLLPVAGLAGGLFMLLVDDVARTVAAQELPVGLLTALVGTPAFALILRRTARAGWRER